MTSVDFPRHSVLLAEGAVFEVEHWYHGDTGFQAALEARRRNRNPEPILLGGGRWMPQHHLFICSRHAVQGREWVGTHVHLRSLRWIEGVPPEGVDVGQHPLEVLLGFEPVVEEGCRAHDE